MIQLYQNTHAKPFCDQLLQKISKKIKSASLHQPHIHLSWDMVCGLPSLLLS